MSISFVLVTFLFQLAVGMMVTIALLPPKCVDRLFFKSISFWATLFATLSFVLKGLSSAELPTILFGLICLQLWGRLRLEKRVLKGELVLIAFLGLGIVIVGGGTFSAPTPPHWIQRLLISAHNISSTFLLGGFLTGMIFGHWYLVNTDMPKKLLLTMTRILIGALLLRIFVIGTTLVLYHVIVREGSHFLRTLSSFQGHGIFFWERVLVGLVIPAIVVGMIWSTARIGSNQSATGIMYVAVAFVFIGELIAKYLFLLSALPL